MNFIYLNIKISLRSLNGHSLEDRQSTTLLTDADYAVKFAEFNLQTFFGKLPNFFVRILPFGKIHWS